ncbi:unnamed protein product [Adineta ricciae]|uniref:Uncharacterized protein n=1 Tax=Adineta ricciae TaxID=249248 RepID=A0A814TMC4_ADIRI|nr:unnamed protein product [Adineta ricciae]CAF1163293.1 unnamed protein product [Adineta ricciae]
MLSEVNNIEGDWNIIDYSQHPECIGCQLEITRDEINPDIFHVQVRIINTIKCDFRYIADIDLWEHSTVVSTKMAGPLEKLNQERVISSFIDSIENLEVQGGVQLIARTVDGDLILLEHPREENQIISSQ